MSEQFLSTFSKLLLVFDKTSYFSGFMTYLNYLLPDLIEPQMLKLFEKASSLVLANITMGIFNDVDEVEVNVLLVLR